MNSKQPAPNMGAGRFGTSEPVSRVLSFKTAIYLDAPLPMRSSHLQNAAGPALTRYHGVAPDRVYSDEQFPVIGRALISAFPPLPCKSKAVYLCCTFPEVAFGGRYPLSLPCGARTFLTAGLSASPRDRLFYSPHYFTGARGGCQRKFAVRRAKYVCHPAAEVL